MTNFFTGRAYLQCNLYKHSIVCNSKNYVCNVDVLSDICDDLHYLWHFKLRQVNLIKFPLCQGMI